MSSRIARAVFVLAVTLTMLLTGCASGGLESGGTGTRREWVEVVNRTDSYLRIRAAPSNRRIGHVDGFRTGCFQLPYGTEALYAEPLAGRGLIFSPVFRSDEHPGWRWAISNVRMDLAIEFAPATPCSGRFA